jgi:hypothetical protein
MITPQEQLSPYIVHVLDRLHGLVETPDGWKACCPAHDDQKPTLHVRVSDNGKILLKCFANCPLETIVEAMELSMADLFPPSSSSSSSSSGSPTTAPSRNMLTLVELAKEKLLPWKLLFQLGVTERAGGSIQIPYHLPDGTVAPRYRIRTALAAKEGSFWNQGAGEILPYGLERLEEARKAGYLVLVEGESDCWTLWFHHFPALGLPGAAMANKLEECYLEGIEKLYILQEPDTAGTRFVKSIEQRLESWKWQGKAYVVTLPGVKDPNELHKQDWKGFKAAFQQALEQAEPLFLTSVASSSSASPASSSSSSYIIPFPLENTPATITLQVLLDKELPPVRWAIPYILPEGLTLLAGKPKQGKSWLALSVALAIAAGGVALGKQPVTQGDVLYLALEDNERRLQTRAKQLLASMTSVPHSIEFALDWPRLDQGGLLYLEAYLEAHPGLRLIVVDTWAKVAPHAQNAQRSLYERDYDALTPLKSLADRYRVAILAVHHLRKTCAEDVLDEISGSTGVSGAIDGALILKRERGQQDATLFVTGRDIEQEQHLALTFEPVTAMWTLVGNAEEFRRTKERQEILDLLTEQCPDGMSAKQIAHALDKNYHTTRSLLHKMEDAGEIRHQGNFYYAPAPTDPPHQDQHPSHMEPTVGKTQTEDQMDEQPSSVIDDIDDIDDADYTDYVDYSDYTDHADYGDDPDAINSSTSVSPYPDANTFSQSQTDMASVQMAGATNHIQVVEDVQQGKDYSEILNSNADKCNGDQRHHCNHCNHCNQCNQRNQSETSSSEITTQYEHDAGQTIGGASDRNSGRNEATIHSSTAKRHCPHHPHIRWVRFDPAGQAWCDKMDCWDCYRLMKIGEALDYREVVGCSYAIGAGMAAWSAFVLSQGSFAILTMTQQAIRLCKSLQIEVPDLSDEVPRLVAAW